MNIEKRNKIIRVVLTLIALIGFLICAGVVMYPVISDRWNRYRDSLLITDYIEAIKKGNPDDHAAELKKAEEYNKALYYQGRDIVTDAGYELDEYYESLLNIMNNGIMGYLEIPIIDVTEPIYHYSTEVSLGEGIGHIHGSSLPVGGSGTHSVLTGHRGLPNQKFFSDLDRMKNGDRFYLHIYGHVLAYQVFSVDIVQPDQIDGLKIEKDKDLVTLVTCTPYGVNTHRLLVTGQRIPYVDEAVDDKGYVTAEKHSVMIDPSIWVFMGFALFLLLLMIVSVTRAIIFRHKKRKTAEKPSDSA